MSHDTMYDTCPDCAGPKRAYARRCRPCGVLARYGPPEARMRARAVEGPGGCLEWNGHIATNGYGRIHWNGRQQQAHRVAYELARGPIPEGLVLDHLCRNRRCINPGHLEAVTEQVNIVRGIGRSAENFTKTHCAEGHPYDRVKVNHGRPTRICMTCKRAREKATKPAWRRRRADACRAALEAR